MRGAAAGLELAAIRKYNRNPDGGGDANEVIRLRAKFPCENSGNRGFGNPCRLGNGFLGYAFFVGNHTEPQPQLFGCGSVKVGGGQFSK